jgi:serine/threonine-protein kinase
VGTPLYLSPEQARGGKVSHRTDLYGLGATLYHMLTGRPPFPGTTIGEVLIGIIGEEAPDVRSLRPEVPEKLSRLIGELMRKDPQERPENGEVVARMLLRRRRKLSEAQRGIEPAGEPG